MTLNSKEQRAEFMPVYDGRKDKIRGLWQRGDIFYARLKIAYPGEDYPKVRRVPLKATSVPEARKEQRKLVVARDKGEVITRERTATPLGSVMVPITVPMVLPVTLRRRLLKVSAM